MLPVVIVGAGMAGLTCARTLRRHGVSFLLVDSDERIGGKVKTDVVGDFHLDHGSQLYFTKYPHAREQIDAEKLQFRRVEPGAVVIWDGEQHLMNPEKPLQFAISDFLSLADKLRFGRWTSDVQWLDQEDIAEIPDRSSEQYLRDQGFSDEFIDRFARPFFGGFFADRSLTTSCRLLVFTWKAISEGETVVPALGMEQIPKQIGVTFGHDVLRLNSTVVQILIRDGAAAGVKLESGEEIEASQVVLACDAGTASKLSGIPFSVEYVPTITLYFIVPFGSIETGVVLNGNARGVTDHLVPVPNVAPTGERQCVAATILGDRPEADEQLAEIVKAEMRLWFPDGDIEAWQFLRGYRIANGRMRQPSGFHDGLPGHDSGIPGLFFAGSFNADDSIDGAIRCGIECAELILSQVEAGVA